MPGETNEKSSKTSKGRLETTESIFRIASYVLVPVVIAIGTWAIQNSVSKQAVSKDYVNMALSLLQKKPENDQERELRDWAVDLFIENSPTKLPESTKTHLKSGVLNFGNLFSGASTSTTFGFAVSPDSRNIAIGGYGESINIYDLATGKLVDAEVPVIVAPSISSVRTTTPPKSRKTFLDEAFDEGKDAATAFIAFGNEFVSALAYSPDGRKLLFGTSEGIVKLWNLDTGEILNFEHE